MIITIVANNNSCDNIGKIMIINLSKIINRNANFKSANIVYNTIMILNINHYLS